MLQSGWRSWPIESYEVHAMHSSSAHTIIVFTFFNAAFLTALFYMSVMAYNEGHYYLYHRVQQGFKQLLKYLNKLNSRRFTRIRHGSNHTRRAS